MKTSIDNKLWSRVSKRLFGRNRRPRDVLVVLQGEVQTTVVQVVAGRVERSESWSSSDTIGDTKDIQVNAAVLNANLERLGIESRNAIFVLDRDSIVLRVVKVPEVSEEETHESIKLQAETLSPFPFEETLCDWIELERDADGMRSFLLGMTKRAVVEEIRETAAVARLDVLAVSIGELACANASTITEENGIAFHLIARREGRSVAVVVSDAGRSVASLTLTSMGNEQSDALRMAGLLQRLRRSLPTAVAAKPVLGAEAFGPVSEPVLAATSSELGVPVHVENTDPTCEIATRVFRSFGDSRVFDFATPKGSAKPRKGRSRRLAVRVAAGVMLGIGVLGWFRWDYTDKQRHIARLQARLDMLDTTIDRSQPILDEAALVTGWESDSVDWRDELPRFLACFDKNDRTRVVSVRLEGATRDGRPIIYTRGLAKDSSDVAELMNRLIQHERGYELSPRVVEASSEDRNFSAAFEIEAALPTLHDDQSEANEL